MGDCPGFVYILQSEKNNSYYIGSTINLEKRVFEHTTGQSKYTSNLLPLKLVFFQEYPSIVTARKLEYWLKKQHSHSLVEEIIASQKIKKKL